MGSDRILEEYRAIRTRAGVIDWATHGLIEVRGADRASFLHNLLTQDITGMATGTSRHAALVSPNAKLLADLLVLADEHAHWLLTDRGRIETVLTTLERYIITEEVSLHDRTAQTAMLAVQGPATSAILRALCPNSPPLQPGAHALCAVDEMTIRLVAHDVTGSTGAVLIVSAHQAARVRERLGAQGIMPVGGEAFNILRLEAGLPWFGIDLNEECLLPETGLETTAVSGTKGCYVGQEVITRLQTYGSVSRKLMGLVCDGSAVPSVGDPIQNDGQPVGEVTSACASPALQRPIALGYVKRPFYEVGTSVELVSGERRIPATLAAWPFV